MTPLCGVSVNPSWPWKLSLVPEESCFLWQRSLLEFCFLSSQSQWCSSDLIRLTVTDSSHRSNCSLQWIKTPEPTGILEKTRCPQHSTVSKLLEPPIDSMMDAFVCTHNSVFALTRGMMDQWNAMNQWRNGLVNDGYPVVALCCTSLFEIGGSYDNLMASGGTHLHWDMLQIAQCGSQC